MPNCTCFEPSTSKKKCPACGDQLSGVKAVSKDGGFQLGRNIVQLYPEDFIVTETYPTHIRIKYPKKNVGGKPQ